MSHHFKFSQLTTYTQYCFRSRFGRGKISSWHGKLRQTSSEDHKTKQVCGYCTGLLGHDAVPGLLGHDAVSCKAPKDNHSTMHNQADNAIAQGMCLKAYAWILMAIHRQFNYTLTCLPPV